MITSQLSTFSRLLGAGVQLSALYFMDPCSAGLQINPLNVKPQMLVAASQANTFTVTNTNDSGAGSLRQAILNANADSTQNPLAINVINFNLGKGNFTIGLTSAPLNITAKNLTVEFKGDIDITGIKTPNINISTGSLTVSGNNKLGVFTVEKGAGASIGGLTIANGVAANGGGVLNDGTLTLSGVTLNRNAATGSGGGVSNNGTLTTSGVSFFGNTATGAGGGIYNTGSLTSTGSSFNGNTALVGGGSISNTGTASIQASSFISNTSANGIGGAIVSSGTLVADTSSFVNNSATLGGGAIYSSGTTTLTFSTIAGNATANKGGGIYSSPTSGVVKFQQGTIAGNRADKATGAPDDTADVFGPLTRIN